MKSDKAKFYHSVQDLFLKRRNSRHHHIKDPENAPDRPGFITAPIQRERPGFIAGLNENPDVTSEILTKSKQTLLKLLAIISFVVILWYVIMK